MTAVVVVGIDGSAHAQRALTWAAEEAKLRGARLRVVHVWSYLARPESRSTPPTAMTMLAGSSKRQSPA